MTIIDFNQTSFGAGDRAIYRGKRYDIISVDFVEQLIGLHGVVKNSDDVTWVRCENIEFISKIKAA